jgi:hypothetical protein
MVNVHVLRIDRPVQDSNFQSVVFIVSSVKAATETESLLEHQSFWRQCSSI